MRRGPLVRRWATRGVEGGIAAGIALLVPLLVPVGRMSPLWVLVRLPVVCPRIPVIVLRFATMLFGRVGLVTFRSHLALVWDRVLEGGARRESGARLVCRRGEVNAYTVLARNHCGTGYSSTTNVHACRPMAMKGRAESTADTPPDQRMHALIARLAVWLREPWWWCHAPWLVTHATVRRARRLVA